MQDFRYPRIGERFVSTRKPQLIIKITHIRAYHDDIPENYRYKYKYVNLDVLTLEPIVDKVPDRIQPWIQFDRNVFQELWEPFTTPNQSFIEHRNDNDAVAKSDLGDDPLVKKNTAIVEEESNHEQCHNTLLLKLIQHHRIPHHEDECSYYKLGKLYVQLYHLVKNDPEKKKLKEEYKNASSHYFKQQIEFIQRMYLENSP